MSFRQTPYGKITSDWEIKKASEYLTVLTDYVANGSFASLKNNVQYYSEPNYAILLRLTDYNNSYKGDFVYIDEKGYNFLSKTKLYGGEIIISNVGANVGTVFKAPRLELKMNLGPNTIMIKTQGNDDFYYYWFKSPQGQAQIKAILSGSAQPKFNKTAFKNIELPIPSLSEQKAIADILSSLDDKIELNNQMNETLEEMAQALFKRWFVDFEFPNEEGQPYKSSGGEMVKSELGMIPKGWKVKTLQEVSVINPRESFKKGAVGTFVEMANLPMHSARVTNYSTKVFNGGTKFRNGDILLARITPCLENGKTALVDFLKNDEVAFGSTEYIVIRPLILGSYYLYCLARLDSFRDYAIKNMNGSSGRQRVDASMIKNYLIASPPGDVLRDFEQYCSALFVGMKENDEQGRNLIELRDTLLPKLMSGEIRVSDFES